MLNSFFQDTKNFIAFNSLISIITYESVLSGITDDAPEILHNGKRKIRTFDIQGSCLLSEYYSLNNFLLNIYFLDLLKNNTIHNLFKNSLTSPISYSIQTEEILNPHNINKDDFEKLDKNFELAINRYNTPFLFSEKYLDDNLKEVSLVKDSFYKQTLIFFKNIKDIKDKNPEVYFKSKEAILSVNIESGVSKSADISLFEKLLDSEIQEKDIEIISNKLFYCYEKYRDIVLKCENSLNILITDELKNIHKKDIFSNYISQLQFFQEKLEKITNDKNIDMIFSYNFFEFIKVATLSEQTHYRGLTERNSLKYKEGISYFYSWRHVFKNNQFLVANELLSSELFYSIDKLKDININTAINKYVNYVNVLKSTFEKEGVPFEVSKQEMLLDAKNTLPLETLKKIALNIQNETILFLNDIFEFLGYKEEFNKETLNEVLEYYKDIFLIAIFQTKIEESHFANFEDEYILYIREASLNEKFIEQDNKKIINKDIITRKKI